MTVELTTSTLNVTHIVLINVNQHAKYRSKVIGLRSC